jgi:hypothetical protein
MIQTIAQQQLTAHLAAWAAIPVALTANNPITHPGTNGPGFVERLTGFTADIRRQEATLLATLNVEQAFVDRFLAKSEQYRLLMWQLPNPWVKADLSRASRVMTDMESLGLSLRTLEKSIASWSSDNTDNIEDHSPVTIGRETHFLRRWLASRATLAVELLDSKGIEPSQAIDIFYEDGIRALRGLDPLRDSLEFYHNRRLSFLP